MFRKLFLGLFMLGLISLIGYGLRPQPASVDFVTVVRGPMRVTVDEEGKTRVRHRYTVSAPLHGNMRRITLDPGDPVYPGQTVIAVIEPTDPGLLDARAHSQALARVKSAEAAKSQAAHQFERAKYAVEHAEVELKRLTELFQRRGTTDVELKEGQLLARTRSEEFKAAKFGQQIADYELEQARAALLQFNPETFAEGHNPRYEVTPPIRGQVLQKIRESAGPVTMGQPLVELGDPTDLEVVVEVLSTDAVKIPAGAAVILEHWGGDKPLNGRVRRVEPGAFTKISALGVEEQRVKVIIDFTDPPSLRQPLGDLYRVEARIVIWQRDDAVKVPLGAIFRQGQTWHAYRVEGSRAKLVPLTVGRMNALEAEVLDGLYPDDLVVAHPGDKVRDGTEVVRRAE